MLDLNEYIIEFRKLKEEFNNLYKYFRLEEKEKELLDIDNKVSENNFWDDNKKAEIILKKQKRLMENISRFKALKEKVKGTEEYLEILKTEFDEEIFKILSKEFKELQNEMEEISDIELLGEAEDLNAIVTIHSGAGGVESCDWTEMLYRMYQKWAFNKGFSIEEVDSVPEERAGFKSVTFIIKGNYASELLKSEMGVHRLIRISPFDSSSRRHTSFASVEVLPEIKDTDEGKIEINEEELRIDTFRASGAGGQHVNKTESAVRIVHLPTNTVVSCQSERSQIQNKARALKILKSKLYLIKQKEKDTIKKELKGEEKEVAFGSQIRSYVFQPYTMVKDHRTLCETGNIESVMNGELNNFIHHYLIYKVRKNGKNN